MFITGLFTVLLGVTSVAEESQDSDATVFRQDRGAWTVLQTEQMAACGALRAATTAGTTVAILADPVEDAMQFAISNTAWKSLEDNESDFRITATFHNAAGKLTDGWDLDAVSQAGTSDQIPAIRFKIRFSKNDQADFVAMFQKSSELWFWKRNTAVPVAKIPLTDSAWVIQSLEKCRTKMRVKPSFDPFAN